MPHYCWVVPASSDNPCKAPHGWAACSGHAASCPSAQSLVALPEAPLIWRKLCQQSWRHIAQHAVKCITWYPMVLVTLPTLLRNSLFCLMWSRTLPIRNTRSGLDFLGAGLMTDSSCHGLSTQSWSLERWKHNWSYRTTTKNNQAR